MSLFQTVSSVLSLATADWHFIGREHGYIQPIPHAKGLVKFIFEVGYPVSVTHTIASALPEWYNMFVVQRKLPHMGSSAHYIKSSWCSRSMICACKF